MCYKAGISSFYGASVLAELAENTKIFDYTVHWLKKVLFSDGIVGKIPGAEQWTGERMEWTKENSFNAKAMMKNQGYEFLQGVGKVQGHLIGGCIDVMEMIKGTSLWLDKENFKGAILFFETSEDMPNPSSLEYWLRNYGSQGILQEVNAIIFGKPYQEKFI